MKTIKAKSAFIIVLSVFFLFMFTGCASKTPQTPDGFIQVMEDAGFEVKDVTEEAEDTDDLATSVLFAVGENYQIEFYELVDNETGAGVFYNNREIFDNEHSVKMMSLSLSSNNYDYYAFNADGQFYMIARIDNTVLYCVADKEYRSEIVDLVETLGYK